MPAGSASRRPDRRPAQTIRKLLDAGLEELRTSTYSGVTMRAVAARAGVSPASAYRYFPSKDALVAGLYLELLQDAPRHVDVNDSAFTRVSSTMRDMALVGADEPELTAACAAALLADDPAVSPVRLEIANEVSARIRSALGPGWTESAKSTLEMAFAGAMMAARVLTVDQIFDRLDDAVALVLGCGAP
ncbi:helix-turn-helix domain-containing protein [Candidatus Mycobacterium wuenschmannii]|uniref:Helix-turn-helix domain-containing protein n=1 Tax=Candidatus Mycobacterium wuenschmannii TaxID=3027808 RepID=A0ABY8W0W0_9MYCO|nr:helix-turn-helix domain-containing protein [Candidatus Mycobacterium wuenschmannii]WIM88087.1 helix-turn-helix domain-containing protein [Candidatus Mycobacterium wuenschmannii]